MVMMCVATLALEKKWAASELWCKANLFDCIFFAEM